MIHGATKKYLDDGYCIHKLFSNTQISNLKKTLYQKILQLDKNKILKNLTLQELPNYHKLNIREKDHSQILKTSTRFIKLDKKMQKFILENKLINTLMLKTWGHNEAIIKWVGSLKNKDIKNNVVGFRISRPSIKNKKDATGVHIDLHVGGKICNDKNVLITIWVPLIGFNQNYSLNISPKSHIKSHSIKNFVYSKTVTNVFSKDYYKKFKFFRPSLSKGKVLTFHPNLLHGNSFNAGKKTRFSLEIRIYNKRNIKKWIN